MSASSGKSRPCMGIPGGMIALLLILGGMIGTFAACTPLPGFGPGGPTPTATAVPSVMITSPKNRDMEKKSSITVYGKASNIPAGMELWLFVKEENIFGFFPQLVGDPANPLPITIFGDGTWSIEDVRIGQVNDPKAVGMTFYLIPVLINQNDQQAHNAIKKYFQQSGLVYQGIQQMSGMQLLAQDQVQVVRQ